MTSFSNGVKASLREAADRLFSYFMLIENKRGNYSFLKGIAPYSGGVVAEAGFEVVHVRLSRYFPLRAGFDAVKAHLKSAGRPIQAMCGMELRSPKPFSFTGFNEFNTRYIDVLRKWNILLDGLNPIARTNIAPEVNPPGEPSLCLLLHRSLEGEAEDVCGCGAGELPAGSLDPQDVVRRRLRGTSGDADRERTFWTGKGSFHRGADARERRRFWGPSQPLYSLGCKSWGSAGLSDV